MSIPNKLDAATGLPGPHPISLVRISMHLKQDVTALTNVIAKLERFLDNGFVPTEQTPAWSETLRRATGVRSSSEVLCRALGRMVWTENQFAKRRALVRYMSLLCQERHSTLFADGFEQECYPEQKWLDPADRSALRSLSDAADGWWPPSARHALEYLQQQPESDGVNR